MAASAAATAFASRVPRALRTGFGDAVSEGIHPRIISSCPDRMSFLSRLAV